MTIVVRYYHGDSKKERDMFSVMVTIVIVHSGSNQTRVPTPSPHTKGNCFTCCLYCSLHYIWPAYLQKPNDQHGSYVQEFCPNCHFNWLDQLVHNRLIWPASKATSRWLLLCMLQCVTFDQLAVWAIFDEIIPLHYCTCHKCIFYLFFINMDFI